jgi:hypothetical protein
MANYVFLICLNPLAALERIQVPSPFLHQGGARVDVRKVGGSLLLMKKSLTRWKWFLKNQQKVTFLPGKLLNER